MFSFYLPQGEDPALYREEVLDRTGRMVEEAKAWNSVLLHENEKGIYGDNAPRCKDLLDQFYGPPLPGGVRLRQLRPGGARRPCPPSRCSSPISPTSTSRTPCSSDGSVVPPGQGDGHVKEILADLIAGGYKGFLSLEPHLTDFMGLAALEQDPQKRGSALDGKSAWKLALDSLKDILRDIPQAKEAL